MHRQLICVAIVMLAGIAAGAARPPAGVLVTARSRSQRPGELVVLTITTPTKVDRVRVEAFGREMPAFVAGPRSWRALVGIDLDVTPGTYPVRVDAGPDPHARFDLRVAPKTFPTRRLRVDEGFVNPPASVQERIDRDAELLARVWADPAPEKLWRAPFVRPVPDPANSRFGTRSVFNGQRRSPHGGADFMSPAGRPIKAPNTGRVVVARDLYFSGNTVVIDHGLGLFSVLAHLSEFAVREGERVEAGQVVGRVGATGRVTGPHLHWAVRVGGARVDPLSVLALLGPRQER